MSDFRVWYRVKDEGATGPEGPNFYVRQRSYATLSQSLHAVAELMGDPGLDGLVIHAGDEATVLSLVLRFLRDRDGEWRLAGANVNTVRK